MRVTLLADASFCPEYKVGGYGFWIVCERGRWGSGGPFREPVANSHVAEMMAIVNALYAGARVNLLLPKDEILIQSDCKAAMGSLSKAITGRAYVENDHKLICTAFNHIRTRLDLTIEFRHVKGHTNYTDPRYASNRMCDLRAKQGMRKARSEAKFASVEPTFDNFARLGKKR